MTQEQKDFLAKIKEYNKISKDKIDPAYDYDFSAFTEPSDWKTATDNLNKRMNKMSPGS